MKVRLVSKNGEVHYFTQFSAYIFRHFLNFHEWPKNGEVLQKLCKVSELYTIFEQKFMESQNFT